MRKYITLFVKKRVGRWFWKILYKILKFFLSFFKENFIRYFKLNYSMEIKMMSLIRAVLFTFKTELGFDR